MSDKDGYGYANAIIAVLGSVVNITTFLVLIKNKKLLNQSTTIFILTLTSFNILYNGIILPIKAVNYFDRK